MSNLDNVAAYRLWSSYDYGDVAQKLMSVLEPEAVYYPKINKK